MLTITTYDRVPAVARGYVRDLRIRWACEEAGLDYRVDTVPLDPRGADHVARQPFAQVPILRDGDRTLFESGAIVLYLAGRSATLLPPGRGPEVTQWVIAALNSVEPWIFPWLIATRFHHDEVAAAKAAPQMNMRLEQLQAVLAGRDWLLDEGFSAADLVMADVLRIVNDTGALAEYPALAGYVARATARPAFARAHAAQMAHFAAGEGAPD